MSQETKNQFYDDAILELKEHAKTSNHEVGLIQVDLAVLKNDVGHIKEDLNEFKDYVKPKLEEMHNTLQRWIGALAVITIISTLLSKLL